MSGQLTRQEKEKRCCGTPDAVFSSEMKGNNIYFMAKLPPGVTIPRKKRSKLKLKVIKSIESRLYKEYKNTIHWAMDVVVRGSYVELNIQIKPDFKMSKEAFNVDDLLHDTLEELLSPFFKT